MCMLHRFKIDGNIVNAAFDTIVKNAERDEVRMFINERISQQIILSDKVDYDLIFDQLLRTK